MDQPVPPALLTDAFEGAGVELDRTQARIKATLTRAGDDVYASGRLKGTVGLRCDACLGPASAAIDAPLTVIYKREAEEEGEDADALAEQELGVHDGKVVDLAPIVREQLILALPMSPRCKEDCRGLCPACGQDLNAAECGHARTPARESPLSALKNLKLD